MKNFIILFILLFVADFVVSSVFDIKLTTHDLLVLKISYGCCGVVFGYLQGVKNNE